MTGIQVDIEIFVQVKYRKSFRDIISSYVVAYDCKARKDHYDQSVQL